MNPIIFALRRPVTVLMLTLALALGGLYSVYRMQKDIFPSLNQPVLYIVHSYGGMDPKQMEGLITNVYETLFQYISGLEHVESRSIQGMVVLKLYFQPGSDMAEATANTVAYSNKAVSIMPVGAQPPFVIRLDAGSMPVGYLVFSSDTKSIGEMQDMAMYRVRPIFASLPGTMSPPPFGGNIRAITINLDPDRLRSYNLSPQDVVEAIDRGNYASPSGNVTIKDQMTVVPSNTMVFKPQELGNVPLKLGQNVYIRDVGTVADSTDIPTGYALINGRKSVYIPVVKRADASTLTVVNEVKANMTRFQAALPDDIKIEYQFDESPIVHRAIESVGVEGALGAGLTGLMVLLFLRDIRSVIVVVLNIPLALLGSVIVLDLTGNTINIMTLGGLALAIGILVDEATVEIENIHTQMEHTPSISRAVRQGNMETAVPRLLALLCILSVFIPSFIMQGAVRALFVPLSLAVGASMVTSYLLSSTLVPVLSVWLLTGHEHQEVANEKKPGLFAKFQHVFDRTVDWTVKHRAIVVLGYLGGTAALIVAVGSQLGRELFPRVDAGQFQMRVRPPQGTQFELTRQVAEKTLDVIAEEAGGKENVDITMGYVGAIPPMFTVNLAYQWMRGSDDGLLRVGLRHGSGIKIFEFQEKLRKAFPEKVGPWFRDELLRLGVPADLAESRSKAIVFAFEPGDLISTTMSLGSPAPIEVVVSGRNLDDSSSFMDKVQAEMTKVPTLRDLQVQQTLHYPTVQVSVDRQRAGLSGVTAHDIGDSLIAATYSSRYTSRNYWVDTVAGTSYQVQVQVPPMHMTDATDVAQIPLTTASNRQTSATRPMDSPSNPSPPLLLRDVARVMRSDMPGEIDRYNMRRYLSLTANVEGEDLGRAIDHVEAAIKAAGTPPKGVEVDMRGQVKPMRQMFLSLEIGLSVAVLVILIMLTAYFQSFRLALTAVASVPAVLTGVVLALYVTGTTLNIESFMGAIMAVGVAVSNAILLVSFGDRHRLEDGMEPALAATTAAKGRLRPILMTSCAMISGMIPMSLGLEEGSEQNAPLGRAVMGGMACSTFAALLVLPAVFTFVMAGASTRSASLDPDDPGSSHYDPEHAPGHDHPPHGAANGTEGTHRSGTLTHHGNGLGNGNGNGNGHSNGHDSDQHPSRELPDHAQPTS